MSLRLRRRRSAEDGVAICLATDSLEPSGLGEHMLGLAAVLRAEGPVSFACPASPAGRLCLDRADRMGIETLALDLADSRSFASLSAWMASRRVEVCHVHAGIVWEGLDLVSAARRSGVPIVVRTEHLPYVFLNEDWRGRYAEALRHLDKLVCVSGEARDSFIAAGVPSELVISIRNGVPALPVTRGRDEVRLSLGLDAKAPMVLTVARYTEQKNHRTLLDAVPAVLARAPLARFVWAGSGPLEGALHGAIQERGLASSVRILGHRGDVADLMAAADLFVLPSRFEGLPLAVLEAMRAGLPVVATRVCGTAEAVVDGVTGLLVEPGDPEALSAAIVELLEQPQRAARMGESGRAKACRVFSIERMGRETLGLYHDLLGSRRERAGIVGSSRMTQSNGASL